jgi:hypothetical protein
MSFEKGKKNQTNLGEPLKPELIFKTWNPLNIRLGFKQESQLSTNLMLKNEIEKKINLENLPK